MVGVLESMRKTTWISLWCLKNTWNNLTCEAYRIKLLQAFNFLKIKEYQHSKLGGIMKQLVIESTDKNDTITDIEEKLEKAMSAIIAQREGKQFTDNFLRYTKEKADVIVNKLFSNMVKEISEVLKK